MDMVRWLMGWCKFKLSMIRIFTALHELDPLFHKVTMQNARLKALVRDLKFHRDPVGTYEGVMIAITHGHISSASTAVNGNNQANSNRR